jgi:hypothetical protein
MTEPTADFLTGRPISREREEMLIKLAADFERDDYEPDTSNATVYVGAEAARQGRELLLSMMTEEELDRITGPGRPSLSGTVGDGPSRKRQVRLPAQLDELLELRIVAEGRGASEILRDALEQYLRAS